MYDHQRLWIISWCSILVKHRTMTEYDVNKIGEENLQQEINQKK